ncbi:MULTISPECIES: hypothetical protein [Lysobacter]|uniref:hypothetical protein n=1 Tax=Lysobacter TaxID=68 RepID=UPI0004D00D69|nr:MULTISPECIES: hypothetical protein [Lysobacter]
MRTARLFAGWLCIALGFGLIVLLGLGVLDPTRDAAAHATSATPVLIALMPSVAIGLTVFALGLWLLATGKKKR